MVAVAPSRYEHFDVFDGWNVSLGDPSPLRHAAVLAVIVRDPKNPGLLLIERSRSLRSHAGQIAFPGGKPELEDEDLLHTALRETREEIGLEPSLLTIHGRLSPVPTPSGFMIVPFVASMPAVDWEMKLDRAEVERLLDIKIKELQNPEIYRMTGLREWRGREYSMHEYAVSEPPVWGATGRMVWDFLRRFERDPAIQSRLENLRE